MAKEKQPGEGKRPGRPVRGDKYATKRIPIGVTPDEKQQFEDAARKAGATSTSDYIRESVQMRLRSIPIYGLACCGNGIEAIQEPVKYVSYIADLLPRSNAELYILIAEGDSMRDHLNAATDIRHDDLLVFRHSDDAENGQIIHYELVDDFGSHTVGIRQFRMSPTGQVSLRANNNAVDPASGQRIYPDIVIPRDTLKICGIWTRVSVSGVPL